MRKTDKIILWPVYFDSTKTRSRGRRVPKKLAVPKPKLEEIKKAAGLLGVKGDVVLDAAYPNIPWQKIGLVMITKKGSKNKITRQIAEKILENRKKTKG